MSTAKTGTMIGGVRHGWRVVALVLAALAFASVASAVVIVSAPRPALAIPLCDESDAPICNRPDPDNPGPFEPPPNGFYWGVPERFNGRAAGFHWDEGNARYDLAHVHPAAWPAHFYACATRDDETASDLGQPTANTYTWVVDGATVATNRSCFLTHSFPRQGTYHVSLTIEGPQVGTFTQTVTIRDIVIVSIGDSFASGEGNPDVVRSGDSPAQWVDRRCHRSANSGPAQAAWRLETADPHTSVTFLSFACSGATINTPDWAHSHDGWPPGQLSPNEEWYDPFRPGDPNKPRGTGVLGSYFGVEPPDPNDYTSHVASQLAQLQTTVYDRRIDALLLSAGGNDVGFGKLIEACIKHADCTTDKHLVTASTEEPDPPMVTVPERFAQGRRTLETKYRQLNDALAALQSPSGAPVRIARTYITEYPDPTTELKDGNVILCDEIVEDIGWQIGSDIAGNEVRWAHERVLPELNKGVFNAAGRHGWVYVDQINSAFQGHGYCVGNSDEYPNSQRWFRTAAESATLQGPDPDNRGTTTGTMHPTTTGLRVQADRLLHYLEGDLAALPVDPGATKFAVNDVSLTEGNSGTKQAEFTISRSGDTSGASSVIWFTANGTAIAPGDYLAVAPTRVDFAPGEKAKTIRVSVNGDDVVEDIELFFVELTDPYRAGIADGSGTGTINNDDTAMAIKNVSLTEGNSGTKQAEFTITRSGSLKRESSAQWTTADGTAVAPRDYLAASGTVTFVPAETVKTVRVTVNGDTEIELNETFKVTLSNPTGGTISRPTGVGTIVDDDFPKVSVNDVSVTEGGSGTRQASFTITRSGTLTEASSVQWATVNGTAVAPGDYGAGSGTASFAAGEATKPVTVLVNGDTVVEANETFSVTLSSPSGAKIADGTGVGTILNDDTGLAISDVSVTEGDSGTTDATFTVTRSGALTGASSVQWATADRTATASGDYAAGSGTVSFAAGEATKPVTVNLSSPTGATVADDTGVGTIVNDDEPIDRPPPCGSRCDW